MAASIKELLKRRLLRILAGAVFTAIVLAFVFSAVTASNLKDVLSRLDISFALLALLSYIGVTALRGWRYVAAGAAVPFHVAFQVASLHSALLRVMPLRSGEFAYGILMRQAGGSNFVAGMASIFLLRILDLAVVLPLAAVVVAVNLSDQISGIGIGMIAAAGFLLSLLFFLIEPILRRIRGRFGDVPPSGVRSKIVKIFDALLEAYHLPLKRRILLVGITALMWGALLVWCHFAFQAIDAVAVFEESIVASVLGIIGSILPLSLLGSFGPMEGGFALGLSIIGQDQGIALANALIASSLTLACSFAVALPCWVAFILDAKARQGAPVTAIRRGLGRLFFSFLGGLLLLFKIPYGFETNDQFQYLLLPYRSIYEAFLVNDWFTWHTSHYHLTFSWLIRGLHAVFGPNLFPIAVFGLHFVVLMGIAYAVLSLARAMRCHWIAACFSLLVVAFIRKSGIGETVVNHGVLLPSDMALPLFLLGLAHWIEKNPLKTGLYLGLAGFIHANFAILGPMTVMVPELWRIAKTREVRPTLKMAGLFALLASPTLIATISAFLAADAAPEALSILFFVRSPHHYDPQLANSSDIYYVVTVVVLGIQLWLAKVDGHRRHTSILLSLVATQLLAVIATATHQPFLVRLFFWRLSIPLVLLCTVAVGQSFVTAFQSKRVVDWLYALSAVAIIASFAAGGSITIVPQLALKGFGWMLPAVVSLLLCVIVKWIPVNAFRRVRPLLVAVPLLLVVMVSEPISVVAERHGLDWHKAGKSWGAFYKVDENRIVGRRRHKAIYRWISENVPNDAVFLIPPGNNDFRFTAKRAAFVDWKCCPMKGEEILEWKRRMLAAMGTKTFPAKGYRLYSVSNKRYLSRSLSSLAATARREGITHILAKTQRGADEAGLAPLKALGSWTIYRVVI
jgi:hypothetical protein